MILGRIASRGATPLLGLTVVLGLVAVDRARAEDTGFWDLFWRTNRSYQRVTPSPWAPLHFEVRRARPSIRRATRPSIEREAPKPQVAAKPPDPATRENPLAALLNDRTLRPGDIVIFPDGPRVFKGAPGQRHAVLDFVKLPAAKGVPNSTRSVLAKVSVGDNDAWRSDLRAAKEQVAQTAPDVQTTGTISGRGRAQR
jgi:hypothetical protein